MQQQVLCKNSINLFFLLRLAESEQAYSPTADVLLIVTQIQLSLLLLFFLIWLFSLLIRIESFSESRLTSTDTFYLLSE